MGWYLRNITKKGIHFKGSYFWNDALAEFIGERAEVDYAGNTLSTIGVQLESGRLILADEVKTGEEE